MAVKEDQESLSKVFNFLQTAAQKTKNQKRKDLNESAIKKAREAIALLGPTKLKTAEKKFNDYTPPTSLRLGELENKLKDVGYILGVFTNESPLKMFIIVPEFYPLFA